MMALSASVRSGTTQPDAPTVRVSPSTGLIGAALPTDEGAELTMFLNPQVKIGGRLELESANAVTVSTVSLACAMMQTIGQGIVRFVTWTDLREL